MLLKLNQIVLLLSWLLLWYFSITFAFYNKISFPNKLFLNFDTVKVYMQKYLYCSIVHTNEVDFPLPLFQLAHCNSFNNMFYCIAKIAFNFLHAE